MIEFRCSTCNSLLVKDIKENKLICLKCEKGAERIVELQEIKLAEDDRDSNKIKKQR